jgi:hypothetical protein
MGYFASRAAALGPVAAAPVVAMFHGFAPSMVARALPAAWSLAAPAEVVDVRQNLAVLALRRAGVAGEASRTTGPLVAALAFPGRPLAAAHAALPRPDDPLRALWWDCTVLRELRGDGHVAALVTHGLDGCEANVLMHGLGLVPERQQQVRGWTDAEWAAAAERLQRRGLLDAQGIATEDGRALRAAIEDVTDATVADVVIPDGVTEALVAAARAVGGSGAVTYPNPVGVPAS